MLRGMHSVLDIGGSSDVIGLFHNSFREYLLDLNRSGSFYIGGTEDNHITLDPPLFYLLINNTDFRPQPRCAA